MNRAEIKERNYYAEGYITLIGTITKETTSIIEDIKKAMCEV